MKINGNAPINTGTQVTSTVIRYPYGSVVNGMTWTLNAADPQINPQPAFPQTGTVA